jgi:hypothetical protein
LVFARLAFCKELHKKLRLTSAISELYLSCASAIDRGHFLLDSSAEGAARFINEGKPPCA